MALIPTWFPREALPTSGTGTSDGAKCTVVRGGMPALISQITISMWGAPQNNLGIQSADSGVIGPGGFGCSFGLGGGGPMPPGSPNTGLLTLNARNHGPTYPTLEDLISNMTFHINSMNLYDAFSGGIEYASSLYAHFIVCVDFIAQTVQCYYNDAVLGLDGGSWGLAKPLNNDTALWSLESPGRYGEVWVSPTKTDLSIVANRRQFINADFTPVQLPGNGAVTFNTGTVTPAVYLRATPWQLGTDTSGTPTKPSPSHPISEFLTNRGTGPNWTGTVYGTTPYDLPPGGDGMLPPATNVIQGNSGNDFQLVSISGTGWGPPQTIVSGGDLGMPATFRYAVFSVWFKNNTTIAAYPAFSWKSATGSGGLQVDVDLTPYATGGDAVVRITAFNGTTVIGTGTAPFSYTGNNGLRGQHVLVSIDSVGQVAQCFCGGAQRAVTMTWNTSLVMTRAPAMELYAWDGSDECIGDLWYSDTNYFYDLTVIPGTTGQQINLLAFVSPPTPFTSYQCMPNALGSNGQGPTNIVPRVYLRAAHADTSGAGWAANLGTGGTFSPVPPLCIPPPPPPDVVLAMDDVVVTAPISVLQTNQISLRWSNDRGHSWGSPVLQDIGEIGQYRTSLQWQRCGMARDRVFEISWSVPMLGALQGAWIDVTPAQS